MYETDLRSEADAGASLSPGPDLSGEGARPAPLRQRAEGRIAIWVEAIGAASRATRIAESGASRLRLPKSPHGLDGVMLNIAGGIACGDRMSVEVDVGESAEITLSTPGAERIYRSDGPSAVIESRLSVGPGGRLSWLPQETILFDSARLERSLEAEIACDARLTICETVAFGRRARGEQVRSGLFEDRWRVRRDGKLIFAETLRLAGPLHDLLAKKTIAGGATSLATILHVGPDAEGLLGPVREALATRSGVEVGATAWNGVLVIRMLSDLTEHLRDAARTLLPVLIDRPVPRVWSS